MDIVQAIVLAIVQGITEFLPISSDGHLVLAPWIFGWEDQGLAFDAAVHMGTLAAVLVYFRELWIALIRGLLTGSDIHFDGVGGAGMRPRRLLVLLILGSLPAAVIGLLLKDTVQGPLRDPVWVGVFLLATSAMLLAGQLVGARSRGVAGTSGLDALLIGVAQGMAVLPGLSRSGSTIAAGVMRGMTREAAARFSFFLAVPAIAGAGLLVLLDAARNPDTSDVGLGAIAVGVAVSFATALVALAFLMRLLRRGSLWPFIIYTAVVGVAVIIAATVGD